MQKSINPVLANNQTDYNDPDSSVKEEATYEKLPAVPEEPVAGEGKEEDRTSERHPAGCFRELQIQYINKGR